MLGLLYSHNDRQKCLSFGIAWYYGTIPPMVQPAQQSSACRYLGPFPLSGEKVTIPA